MKKLPKIVQTDKRGQIVIPKEARQALNIDEAQGFHLYVIEGEGILLKLAEKPNLSQENIIEELRHNASKLGIEQEKIDQLVEDYKENKGGLEDV